MKKTLIPIVELITAKLTSIGLRRVVMSLHRPSKTRREKPALATESGFYFRLENGGRILLEKERTKVFPPREPEPPSILLENGSSLLSEDGNKINLENND